MSDVTTSAASVNPNTAAVTPGQEQAGDPYATREVREAQARLRVLEAEQVAEAERQRAALSAAPAAAMESTAAPAAPTAEQAQAAAERAAEAEKAAREAADRLRVKAVAAYRKGDAAYAAGLLESGRLCGEYVAARLVISATAGERKAAVDILTLELSLVDGSTVDVNRLVRTYHATRLLPPGKAKGQATAYRTYRDHWCRLLERQSGLGGEEYVLLPGLEADCQAAFAKAAADSVSAAGCKELADAIVAKHAKAQAERQSAAAEQAKAARVVEAARLNAAAEGLRAAQAANAAAEKAAAEAREEDKAKAAEAVAESAAKLQEAQRAAVEQQARLEQAEREQKAAEKARAAEADKLAKQAAKAEEKSRKVEQAATSAADHPATASTREEQARDPRNPADKRGEVRGNLLQAAAAGTAKDVAEWAAELVTGSETPDDVFAELLRMLKASGELSKASGRAIDAALLILARGEQTTPPAVAERLRGGLDVAKAG